MEARPKSVTVESQLVPLQLAAVLLVLGAVCGGVSGARVAADHRYYKRLGTTTAMIEEYEVRELHEESNRLLIQFLNVELKIGGAYCETARIEGSLYDDDEPSNQARDNVRSTIRVVSQYIAPLALLSIITAQDAAANSDSHNHATGPGERDRARQAWARTGSHQGRLSPF